MSYKAQDVLKIRWVRQLLYQLELIWIRGALVQMGFLLLVLALLAGLGGVVMVLVHPRYGDVSQATWWAFLHLTDTGYLGEDKDPVERSVAVVLTFTGAVLFVGGVIAVLTTSLDRLMAWLSSGRGSVVEEGHLLLLGSHPGLADLVAECASAAALRWPEGRLPTIVVMSEQPLEWRRPAGLDPRQRVVVRTGSPAERDSLERADYSRARVVLLLSSRAKRGAGPSDLNVLKTLVALRSALPDGGPRLVLDLSFAANAKLIPSLAGKLKTDVVSSLEFSGRLLCQALRYPGISRVYRQLLSDTLGQSLLLNPCPTSLWGSSLGAVRGQVRGAILLGVISRGQARLLDWEHRLEREDELVLLASSLRRLRFELAGPPPAAFGKPEYGDSAGRLQVLVVGWSEALLSVASEWRRYQNEEIEVTVAEALSQEREQLLRDALGPHTSLTVLPFRLRSAEDLRRLPQDRYDRILLLTSEAPDPATADAETALRYALLLGRSERFVVELHEESNAPLFGEVHDVVITDQVVNHSLAQISLKPAFAELYEELFTEGGSELRLSSGRALLGGQKFSPGPIQWLELSQQLFERGYLGLGVELEELMLNPDPALSFELWEDTRILVLTQVFQTVA
ncbi:hypothetical protein ABS71_18180 [bacterium SCN 62-11]|nr:MAG: hypothetical protein ABS71_18180 [bacterium SCN 62-11]